MQGGKGAKSERFFNTEAVNIPLEKFTVEETHVEVVMKRLTFAGSHLSKNVFKAGRVVTSKVFFIISGGENELKEGNVSSSCF